MYVLLVLGKQQWHPGASSCVDVVSVVVVACSVAARKSNENAAPPESVATISTASGNLRGQSAT